MLFKMVFYIDLHIYHFSIFALNHNFLPSNLHPQSHGTDFTNDSDSFIPLIHLHHLFYLKHIIYELDHQHYYNLGSKLTING